MASSIFPKGFIWGSATAAAQIEGAAHEGGKEDSIWDAFARLPNAVAGGDTPERGVDHYHRMPQDVALMKELGLDSYRFSTSWARVVPGGRAVNAEGLDFYSRLVDELLEAGILPWLTLYHWDLPQALQEQGGWANRDTAELFRDYALSMHDALGDRVDVWTTLNEPWCSSFLSYTGGAHAPGRQDVAAGLAAGHHLLLAHGLAVQALRERDPGLELGITLNLAPVHPVDPSDAGDVDAARRIDGQFNRFFLDPIFRGAYADDLLADVGPLGLDAVVRPGDLEVISTPIDTLGVNYYHGEHVSARPAPVALQGSAPTDRPTRSPFPAAEGVHWHPQGLPTTAMDWEVEPDGLRELLVRVHREYADAAGVKLYVTENGAAYDDAVAADDAVHDTERAEFLRGHLGAILDAIDEGAPVHGYFYWSLLDNFEWAWGYDKRFGLVRVDYDTQVRTVKDSGLAYSAIIRDRALPGR